MISEFILKKDAIAPNATIIHPITTNKKPLTRLTLEKSPEKDAKLFREPIIKKKPIATSITPAIPYIIVHANHAKAPLQALPQVTIGLASVSYFRAMHLSFCHREVVSYQKAKEQTFAIIP